MTEISLPRPLVGVSVAVIKEGRILTGRRLSKHQHGKWAFPGGHMEGGETFEETVRREVTEEAGISIKNIRFWDVTNDRYWDEGKHYVTVFMMADWDKGEPQTMEPDKCEGWFWLPWESIPEPWMSGLSQLKKRWAKVPWTPASVVGDTPLWGKMGEWLLYETLEKKDESGSSS